MKLSSFPTSSVAYRARIALNPTAAATAREPRFEMIEATFRSGGATQ